MIETTKTGLVVLFNHNYEKNIPLIKEIYRSRFSEIRIIMPFYYGEDEEVIRVYGNSFQFHTYICQARKKLHQMDCNNYLIIGDDLLLNPDINENTAHHILNPHKEFYVDGVINVNTGGCYRAAMEAHAFQTAPAGLDDSAKRIIPTYEEAERLLKAKGVMNTSVISHWEPYYPLWKKPFLANTVQNYRIFKARVYHWLHWLKYKLFPKQMSYPCVFGYSDILAIPKSRLNDLCNYLEVFATWNMFVELAIPTSIMLLPNAEVRFADSIEYKTGNVWFPQNPVHFKEIDNVIQTLHAKSCCSISGLNENFPKEYLYLHPVKLSRYANCNKI